jgi:tetratricopeptide (TPR) repeat protein
LQRIAMILVLMLAPLPAAKPDTQAGAGSSLVSLPQADRESQNAAAARLEIKFETMQTKAEAALAKAEKGDDQIRQQMSVMLTFTTWSLGFLGIVISGIAIWAGIEVGRVGKARKTAEKITAKIDARVMALVKEAVGKAMKTASTELPRLADEARLVTDPVPCIAPEDRLKYEEADYLMTLGYRMDAIGDKEQIANYYMDLAHCWWLVGDWARASSRSKRAISSNPTSAQVYWKFAEGLIHRIGRREADTATQLELLGEAEQNIDTAQQLRYDDLAEIEYKKGWIADERKDYPGAIAHYQRAIDRVKKREREVQYRYDFACTLAKVTKIDEAIAQLKIIANERWDMAQREPDFAGIRNSPDHRAGFEALIAEGKRASSQAT